MPRRQRRWLNRTRAVKRAGSGANASPRRPAFASGGLRDQIVVAQLAERSRGRAEAQLLYGVRSDLADRLATAGWRVRIYTPYGPDWWPYSLRRMAERPANLRFVLRSLVGR